MNSPITDVDIKSGRQLAREGNPDASIAFFRDLVAAHPKITGFESWHEVPDLLPAFRERAG